jgi:hypothetical protein
VLRIGNLTDSSLKWSLRDRYDILRTVAAAKAAGIVVPDVSGRARCHNAIFRECQVVYHPGHSCFVAHSCKCARRGCMHFGG